MFASSFGRSYLRPYAKPLASDGVSGVVADTPPTVTTNPQSQTVAEGTTATFTVSASGSNAKTYQWEISTNSGVDWSEIVGATSPSYTTGALTEAGDSGDQFRCVVTNDFGSDTSDAATLTVIAAPVITDQPDDTSVSVGAEASFTVAATGSGTLTYQWERSTDSGSNWSDISGATSTTHTIAETVEGEDGYQYRCKVTNAGGTTTSSAATLTVTAGATATGGTITEAGGYKIHTFTSSGDFVVSGGSLDVEYLIVAGGGGGGSLTLITNCYAGGGGGAGGLLNGAKTVASGTHPIVVGAGGAAGTNGSDASGLELTSVGGGGGANGRLSPAINGNSGGSGGASAAGGTGGTGTTGQGNAGASSLSTTGASGGGGGAGGAGGQISGTSGGSGGAGLTVWSTAYAAGGNGGSYGTRASGSNGTASRGNGGAGASSSGVGSLFDGGSGGSGIVIIKYLL